MRTRRVAALPLLVQSFLVMFASYIVRPSSSYRAIELGLDTGMVGLITASFALLPLVVAVPLGRWTDRGRERATLVLGATVLLAAGVGLLVRSDSLGLLLLWNALVGLGHLLSVIGQQSLVARVGSSGLDSAFGTYTFANSLGQALAPLLIAAVGGRTVMPNTFALFVAYTLACAAALAATVALFPLIGRLAPRSVRTATGGRQPLGRAARRTMIGAMALSTLVLAAIDLIQVYLPALGVERGIESWVIGVLLMVRSGATMFSRLGLARLAERYGRRHLVVVSSVVAGLAVAVLALPVHPGVLGAALLVAGFCLGVGQPLSMTIVTVAAPPGTVSTWLAVRLMGNRLGQTIVPTLVTLVSAATGTAGIFVVTGVGLLGTAALAQATIADAPPTRGPGPLPPEVVAEAGTDS